MITIIIPANNEEGYIGPCLDGLLASTGLEHVTAPLQLIVVANGCRDKTVDEAHTRALGFADKGWNFTVLDLIEGSKIAALNVGDQAARYDMRAYIDADIVMSSSLVAQLIETLEGQAPTYASGHPMVPPARSFVSRRYAQFWEQLPFIRNGVPGCGVYAVNAAGRQRWDVFPDIISDDTFVRFHFSLAERQKVRATFLWPITEGFANLVRVRRRQDEGLAQMRRLYPDLARKVETTAPTTYQKLRLLLNDPVGFIVYAAVALAVRSPLFGNRGGWDRGR